MEKIVYVPEISKDKDLTPISSNQKIRTSLCQKCYLCGNQGEYLYRGLKDHLFGVPGEWNLKRCIDQECGLLWLDPMPLEEDIGKAYLTYYTHKQYRNPSKQAPHARIIYSSFKRSYRTLIRILLKLTSISARKRLRYLMWLQGETPGKLLEVGCGSGERLAELKSIGWETVGQEIDPEAIAHARQVYGVEVYAGPLEEAAFQAATFDVVIMHHVIEHVYDPVSMLKECYRVLKPGGKLVVVTPNAESMGHKQFGKNWRGLEPPRHLHIFSPITLREVALKAGYEQIRIKTISLNARWIAETGIEFSGKKSTDISLPYQVLNRFRAFCFQLKESIVLILRPTCGEEVVVFAIKR